MGIENLQSIVSELVDDLVTYTLKKPVLNLDGSTVTTVKVKTEFTGADLEAIGNASDKEGTAMITIVAKAANLPLGVVRNMSGKDVRAIAKMVQDFLGAGES